MSTNCFASISVESELHHVIPNRPHKIGIALASAKSCFVNEDMALLFLKTGAIYSVHLRRDSRGSNTVASLYMNRVASSKSAISCVTRLRSTYEKYDEEDGEQEVNVVFCGSRLGSSLVFQVRRFVDVEEEEVQEEATSSKVDVVKNEEEEDEDEEERALYGYEKDDEDRANQEGTRTTLTRDSFTVTCADEIRGLGPVSDLTIGHVKRREQQIIEEEEGEESKDEVMKPKTELNLDEFHLELVLCSGQGRSGGLRIVSNGVRPAVLETFRDFNVSACWTLRNTRNQDDEKEEEERGEHHKTLVLRNVDENNKDELFAFRVLSEELRRVNVSSLGLSNEDHTVGIHDLQLGESTRVIVQVHRNVGLRIIDSNSKSVSKIALKNQIVTHSHSISSHLHLRFQSGAVKIFALRNSKKKLVEMVQITKRVSTCTSSSMFRCSLSLKCEEKEEDVVEMKENQENVQSDSESEEDEEMYLYGNNQENSKRQRLVSSSSRDFSDVDLTTSSLEDGHVYVAVIVSSDDENVRIALQKRKCIRILQSSNTGTENLRSFGILRLHFTHIR